MGLKTCGPLYLILSPTFEAIWPFLHCRIASNSCNTSPRAVTPSALENLNSWNLNVWEHVWTRAFNEGCWIRGLIVMGEGKGWCAKNVEGWSQRTLIIVVRSRVWIGIREVPRVDRHSMLPHVDSSRRVANSPFSFLVVSLRFSVFMLVPKGRSIS